MTAMGSWEGPDSTVSGNVNRVVSKLLVYAQAKIEQFKVQRNTDADPYPFRIWFLKKTIVPLVVKSRWYQAKLATLGRMVARAYTRQLLARGTDAGEIEQQEFFKNARANTPWAKALDQAIADYIGAEVKKREVAIELVKQIRSLELRDKTYRKILDDYGEPKTGLIEKAKAYWDLYLAYREAKDIWTDEVIEDLKQTDSLLEAAKVTEKAWDDHVARRASDKGVSKVDAYLLLKKLHEANQKVASPYGAEVAAVFVEASRYRDAYLEEYAKSHAMTVEQLKTLEQFKSRKSESPYHKIAKGLFELIDEYTEKLTPIERAQVGLYLAGLEPELPPELDRKVRDLFYGTDNRRTAIQQHGYFLSLADIRMVFRETHVEEKMVAFRALFVGKGGISGDVEAEKFLSDRLLLSDPNMPKFLRKVLGLYLEVSNDTERSVLLSWLMANGEEGALDGPAVVRLLVEKGGVGAAKLAQIVASHGFKLPKEYQDALEKFKGNAQKVDELEAVRWMRERLPEDKFAQIKSFDRELGSGSFKIGYLVTLKDKRKIVIKLSRNYVYAKTAREFEVMHALLDRMMDDPELRIEVLPGMETEIQRLIKDEADFRREFQKEQLHEQALESRPILVRLVGGAFSIEIPQPLAGWEGEDILAEEYVEAKKFGELPETSFTGGWTKSKLARAAIDEVLNQLAAYIDPSEHVDGMIIVDIDAHEDNQLAKTGFFKRMVDIDLGQSVRVKPEVVRGFVRILYNVYQGDLAQATESARAFMTFTDPKHAERFQAELTKQAGLNKDPVEVLIKTVEETQLEGIALRPEYLFLQKLFATLVGLKRHVNDDNYFVSSLRKIILMRAISNPAQALRELKMLTNPCEAALLPKVKDGP
jgi:predicted unusual protein kinase regulating ubiquinone biosynthesis (AarF/ABC1/UbiB family)/uncharacterized protein YcbK (DUF882 family)